MFTIKKTCSHEIPLKIDREILKKIMVRLSSARVVRLPDVVAPVLQPFSSPLPDFVQHPSKATLAGAGGGSGEKRGNKRAEHVDFTWESWVRTMENFVFLERLRFVRIKMMIFIEKTSCFTNQNQQTWCF
jgi:hypothetical protein